MYKILNKENEVIGYDDEIDFIRLSPNGTFVEANKNNATGIIFNNTPYNLIGHSNIERDNITILSYDNEGNAKDVNVTRVIADEVSVLKYNGAEEVQTISENTKNSELMLLSSLGFEVADTDLAIETLVEKNIDKLAHTPIIGETWREDANYMKGDEVVSLVDNQTYVASFYNKNKEPSLGLMKNKKFLYWELKPTTPVYPSYEELEEGVIEKGVICTYEGITYECKKQHFKSVLYLPTKNSHWTAI